MSDGLSLSRKSCLNQCNENSFVIFFEIVRIVLKIICTIFFGFSMTRTIFEIIFLTEILYLAFHYYKLFKNVVKIRRETKISIGHNNKKLERAVRAHGNFCETSPLIIILNFILYFNNLLFFAVLSLLFLAIGRTIHSFAVSDINEDINDRRKGMKFTIYSLFIAIIGIIFYIIKLIYYLFQANINTTFLPQYFFVI